MSVELESDGYGDLLNIWTYICTDNHKGDPIICKITDPRLDHDEDGPTWDYKAIDWIIPDGAVFFDFQVNGTREEKANDSYYDEISEDVLMAFSL